MSTEPTARSKSPIMLSVTDDDATNKLIRDLIKKRAIVKGRLTRFSNHLNTIKSDVILPVQTRVDLKLRIQGASSLFTEFNHLQTQLEESVLETDLDEQLNQRELFENSYYTTLARAECMLGNGEADSSCKKAHTNDIKSVKLPTISIPTFDGSYEHWLEFRDTFQSLIHNADHITSIQKFHYLKSSLKGSAALVIDSLEFSAANYAVAWELLLSRYDNSRLLVHNHVKSLFNIQALTKEAPDLLRRLIDTILKNLRALKLLGEPVDSWDTLIVYIVVTKLDKITEREWEQYKNTALKQSGDSKSILKVDVLLSFLKDRADMLETLQVSHASTKQITNNIQNNHKVHCNVSTDNPHCQAKKSCLLCKQHNHPLYACQRFLSLGLDARIKFVKDNRLCDNCLRAGHTVNDCRFGPCRKCEQRHNSLIHKDSAVSCDVASHSSGENSQPVSAMEPPLAVPSASPSSDEPTVGTHTNILCANYSCVQPVLLSTALIEVKDRYNNYKSARALLDSGSERCIITRSLCDKLGTPLIQSTHEVRGVGNSVSQSTQMCDIEVKSRINPFIMRLQCIVLPNITSSLPAISEQYAKFGIPGNLQLADPNFHESQNIDILIGADKFWDLISEGKMRLPKGPFLQNTKLGWIVSGPINNIMRNNSYVRCNFLQFQSVETPLRKVWELEEIPKLCDARSQEKECEDIRKTPLESSSQSLGEARPQALSQFLSLETRLQRDQPYINLFQRSLGIVTRAGLCESHILTDAPPTAYVSCSHRTTSASVRQLCYKGKVAPPSRPVTIPRLKLYVALLGAQLCLQISGSYLALDSSPSIMRDEISRVRTNAVNDLLSQQPFNKNNDFICTKQPIIMRSNIGFQLLLIRHEHQRLLHDAPQALPYIHQRWWSVGGRNVARMMMNDCVAFKRFKGKTFNLITGHLPKDLLCPAYPFLHCEVDNVGPMLTLNRKGRWCFQIVYLFFMLVYAILTART